MDWLLVRCWDEYCGAVNGRNDLDACWLIAHDARIPFPLQAIRNESLRAGSKDHSRQHCLQGEGRALALLCWVRYEVETPANACDTGRQTASYFVLGKLPRLGSCSSVDWQPQQSAASRFVGSEIGVEKVKRKQLQRTGPQVFAPSQSSVFQVFILCADVCLHPLIPARSGFCLCQLSLLWFCLLCFTTGYCIHCQKAICVFRVHFRKTE